MNGENNIPQRSNWQRTLGFYAAFFAVAFLLGFVPMWFSARQTAFERDAAQRAWRLSRIENMLASAAIDARRGDYEPARQTASTFFTTLTTEIENKQNPIFNAEQLPQINSLQAQRDELITLLARSDPASADRLAEAFLIYRKTVEPIQ